MAGEAPLPDALARVLLHPGLRKQWDRLPEVDRQRYASWIARARTARSSRRRTDLVADRVRGGRGWVGQPRRLLDSLFLLPPQVSAEDAYNADHRGSSEFRRQMDINAYGVLLGIKHAGRVMPPGSAIVNTASIAAKVAGHGYGSYAASKAVVVALTQVAAIEYGPRGIRVNCICPSSVETPMLQAQDNGDVERELTRLGSPLGTTITPEQVADVITFLASPASSAITGQALNVDGGLTAGFATGLIQAALAGLDR